MDPLNLSGIRHAVVVAPHSDDETIGAFHIITALREYGARVDVVVATDGVASHRNSPSWPAHRLAAARKRETEEAMGKAGVGPERIQFLDLPDGGLCDLKFTERCRTIASLRKRPIPDLVIAPSFYDDHPDHRVVAKLCRRAWGPAIPSLSYLVWSGPKAPRDGPRFYVDGDAAAKRAALGCYHTQLGLIRDDPDGFELTTDMQARMCSAREWFAC